MRPASLTAVHRRTFDLARVCRAVAVALTADTGAALDTGPGCQLSLHMPATIRVTRHATSERGAAHEILDLAGALEAGQGTSWSHTCPWGAEIRFAPRATVASGVWTPQRGTPAQGGCMIVVTQPVSRGRCDHWHRCRVAAGPQL